MSTTIKRIKINYSKVKTAFASLGIKKPVGVIAFISSAKDRDALAQAGLKPNRKSVPAGCSFWDLSTRSIFSTVSADHANCSIGMYTHNLIHEESDKGRLMEDLSLMGKVDYVRKEEVPGIPSIKKSHTGVVYANVNHLSKTDTTSKAISACLHPSAFYVFANDEQGLAITEAVSRVDGGFPPAMGRPACAVIPQVVSSGKAAVSFGCCGARAYVAGLDASKHLWVFPAKKISAYADALATFVNANAFLSKTHTSRNASFKKGAKPEIKEVVAKIMSKSAKPKKSTKSKKLA